MPAERPVADDARDCEERAGACRLECNLLPPAVAFGRRVLAAQRGRRAGGDFEGRRTIADTAPLPRPAALGAVAVVHVERQSAEEDDLAALYGHLVPPELAVSGDL